MLCLAAGNHMTPQLMTAFPPAETPSAYSWALASLRGPSGNVLHPSKKLHLYIDVKCAGDPYFLQALCITQKYLGVCVCLSPQCYLCSGTCIKAIGVCKISAFDPLDCLTRQQPPLSANIHPCGVSRGRCRQSELGNFIPGRHSSIHIARWMNLRDI